MDNKVEKEIINLFDWEKAIELLEKFKPERAEAGLHQDYHYTAGTIVEKGKILKEHGAYLGSYWATPILRIYLTNEMGDYSADFPCYKQIEVIGRGEYQCPNKLRLAYNRKIKKES